MRQGSQVLTIFRGSPKGKSCTGDPSRGPLVCWDGKGTTKISNPPQLHAQHGTKLCHVIKQDEFVLVVNREGRIQPKESTSHAVNQGSHCGEWNLESLQAIMKVQERARIQLRIPAFLVFTDLASWA